MDPTLSQSAWNIWATSVDPLADELGFGMFWHFYCRTGSLKIKCMGPELLSDHNLEYWLFNIMWHIELLSRPIILLDVIVLCGNNLEQEKRHDAFRRICEREEKQTDKPSPDLKLGPPVINMVTLPSNHLADA